MNYKVCTPTNASTCGAGFGNCGAPNKQLAYGHLFNTQQEYTVSRYPQWANTQGYTDFTQLSTPNGSYQNYPWGAFHPLYVSMGLGYRYPGNAPPGPWTTLDQRPKLC